MIYMHVSLKTDITIYGQQWKGSIPERSGQTYFIKQLYHKENMKYEKIK